MNPLDRYRTILNRAAELGASRYQLSTIAGDDPARWQRLADVAREGASLKRELQHLNVTLVAAAAELHTAPCN